MIMKVVFRMLLIRGQNCEEVARNALGEGEESLKEKFRSLILIDYSINGSRSQKSSLQKVVKNNKVSQY